jgi:hypothetical protein
MVIITNNIINTVGLYRISDYSGIGLQRCYGAIIVGLFSMDYILANFAIEKWSMQFYL